MARYVIKSSGHREPFNISKFKRSLHRVGARPDLIETITDAVVSDPQLNTTQKIYRYAYDQLKGISRPVAARYSLKHALYELGPTGFVFERFMGEIFKAQGYAVHLDLIIQGVCIDHEIDLIIEKEGQRFMVECKFHNRLGVKTEVRDALYTKARFDDLSAQWSKSVRPDMACNGVYLATNTQFTSKAVTYSLCAGVKLLGWSYPDHEGIASLIDSLGLHPITGLTCLSTTQKRHLIDLGIILCKDLAARPDLLKTLHLSALEEENVSNECKALCKIEK